MKWTPGYEDFSLDMMCGVGYDIYRDLVGGHARSESQWMALEEEGAREDLIANGKDPDMSWGDYIGGEW
jgi:hypothetical protein